MNILMTFFPILTLSGLSFQSLIFSKENIKTFNKKSIISKTSIFKRTDIIDISVDIGSKTVFYKLGLFYKFTNSRYPDEKKVYFRFSAKDDWILLPKGCLIPMFDYNEEIKPTINLCSSNYEKGTTVIQNLSSFFFRASLIISMDKKMNFFFAEGN